MAKKVAAKKSSEVRISILQRGWVYVGYYERKGERCFLRNAKNIRRWGTTRGLGELVNGPLKDTVLDPAGTVEYHELTEIGTIACNKESWRAALGE